MEEFDLDFDVSVFKNVQSTDVEESVPISVLLGQIADGKHKEEIELLRKSDKKTADEIKTKQLPMLSMHGNFHNRREKADFYAPSGIIIVDIDDISGNVEEVKEQIVEEVDHILAAMVSPSGNGIKVLYLVDSKIVNKDTYRQIGKIISKKFMKFGVIDILSVTDCLITTYDPNIIVDFYTEPDLDIKLPKATNKSINHNDLVLDEDREQYDDPEEFYRKVLLNSIQQKSDNNFHFIQMSVFDLARFGFKDPEYDLSFVVEYSEEYHKVSSDNFKRLKEASIEAKNILQERYPYLVSEEFEVRGIKKKTPNKPVSEKDDVEEYVETEVDETNSEVEEEEWDGLEDYDDILSGVREVYDRGERAGMEISFSNFADILRFKMGVLCTVIGIPSSGKSEVVDSLIIDLYRMFDLGTLVIGWEQTKEEHLWKLGRKMLGYFPKKGTDKAKKDEMTREIVKKIKHLNVNEIGNDINKLLKYAEIAIKKHDLKVLVLDPFNHISTKHVGSDHSQVNDILKKIVSFTKRMNVLTFLVVHPTKMQQDEKTGKFKVPNLYNAKGSSAFYEMTYDGFVVYRDDDEEDVPVMVQTLKVKQNNMGTAHKKAFFRYTKPSGRFIPVDPDGEELEGDWNDKNWLEKYKEKFER